MSAFAAVTSASSARTQKQEPHTLLDVFSERKLSSFDMATAAAAAAPPPAAPRTARTASFAALRPSTAPSHASSAIAAEYASRTERCSKKRVARSGL